MKIYSRLQKLGLTDNEITVYLALLRHGKATGYEIAKQTGLTQPSVYFILDKLREKNLALKTPHGKRHYYVAKNPRELLDEKKKELESVEDIMPSLLEMTFKEYSPKLFSFDSIQGVQEWITYAAERFKGQEMLSFFRHSADGITKESFEINELYFDAIGKANIHIRGINPDQQIINEFMKKYVKKYNWEIKQLPLDVYAPHTAVNTIGSSVLINSPRQKQSILIENKDFADQQRQVFELLWKTI